MDFLTTKDEAHEWVLHIGVVFMSVVIMVSALRARNNQKKKKEEDNKMGNFSGLTTRSANDFEVRQGYQ